MLITACGTNPSPSPEAPTSSPEATPEITPSPSPEAAKVALSDYCIIYPEPTLISGSLYQTLARDFSFSIKSKVGINVEAYEDIIDEANGYFEEKYEILVGNTNRAESAQVIAQYTDLRRLDFVIKFVNDKIVVYAVSEEGYNLAFDAFSQFCIDNNISSGDCYSTLSSLDTLSRYGKYDSFAINGVSIENFKLVTTLPEERNEELLNDLLEATGYDIALGDNGTATEYEIIIGYINRSEQYQVSSTLRDLDWTVSVTDKKIVILGATNKLLNLAIDSFVNDYLKNRTEKDVNLTSSDSTTFRHTYPMSSITLLGSDVSEYVIYASKSNDTAANAIQEHINNLTGIKLKIVTSGVYEKAIVLGNARTQQFMELSTSLNDDEYLIKTVGSKIYLGSLNDYHGDGPAIYKFFEDYIGYDIRNNKIASETASVTDIEFYGDIDYYLTQIATKELLDEIDEAAEERKQAILNSVTNVTYTGTAYFVSNDGNDENDGLTPETAWATLQKVSSADLKKGDAVFFNRGDIFRGGLGAAKGVTYSAYGEGEKPRIYGSPFDGATHGYWEEVAPNVYKYSERFEGDIGLISMNNSEYVALKILRHYGDHKNTTNYVTGKPFSSYLDMNEDMTFWHDLGQASNKAYNSNYGWVYLYSTEGNPADRFYNIEFNTFGNIIGCNSDVTLDNLCIMYGGCHGIAASDGTTLQNSVVAWIGGSIQNYDDNGRPTRYGNGIEAWGSVNNYTVKDCYIYQCYDAGITHQGYGGIMQNINYCGNLLEYNIYNIEYFLGFPDPYMESRMENVYITDNIMRYAGYGWGMQRPDNYAGNLQGWGHWNFKEYDADFIIKDNIILGSAYHLVAAGTWDDGCNPTFIDNIFIQDERGANTQHSDATMWDKADPEYWAHMKSFGFIGTDTEYKSFDYNAFDTQYFRNNEFYIIYNE